jgi:hypothetical protein
MIAVCYVGLAVAAQAQTWRPIARQCAEEIDAKTGCGSCGGLWPSWADCAVDRFYRGAVPEARVRSCIKQIYAERLRTKPCNACGDPVADVFRCVGG